MAVDDQQLVYDLCAWLFNVSTSVTIVFVNKVLMSSGSGYSFKFAVTLCALHFLSCGGGLWVMQFLGLRERSTKVIPWSDKTTFAVAANLSIASLNLSLMLNSVGFYQIAKLLIIPFTAVVEAVWLKEKLTMAQTISTAAVLAGVAIVTVSDVNASWIGVVVAAVSVVSSAMQQILCRVLLKRHDVQSFELLAATAPLQGWSLLLVGPFLDKLFTSRWVLDYEMHVPAFLCLTLSCAVAVMVNISQFMCLGRFSAVTFQVTGHAKTVMVLMGGWAYLGEPLVPKQVAGMSLAVLGMITYGYFTSKKKSSGPTIGPGSTNGKAPLLVPAKV